MGSRSSNSNTLNRRQVIKRGGLLAGAALAASRGGALATGGAGQRPGRGHYADSIEISIWTAFPELDKFLTEVGPKYTEEHPNVKIVNTLFPQRALEEKLAAALPAGEGPDLIELDRHEIFSYFANDQILPVDDETADYVRQYWPEFSVKNVTSKDGDIYSLPWIAQPKMMFYNTDMFAEAGITSTPETVDEMMAMAETLTKRDGSGNIVTQGIDLRLSGGGFGTAEKFWFQAMIPYGAHPMVQDGDKYKAGYDNDEGVASLNMYIDALYVRKVSSFDAKHDAEGFGLGQGAMFQRESWVVDYLAANAPDIKYDVFPMPKGPGGWGNLGGTLGLSITSSSKHQKEANDFIRWVSTPERSARTYEISCWQPWRTKDVDFGDLYERKPVLKKFVDDLESGGATLYDYESIPPVAEIYSRMADRLMPAFKESSLAENPDGQKKVMHDMAEETNSVLKDWDLLAK
ncbi:MAG TPA: sugar ABC transporter substrate-binding protein [Thermomicrobiales bacterium]|nr:sugar ABC transporter substrate-binding protein [Thermomicrobiales bacterium]